MMKRIIKLLTPIFIFVATFVIASAMTDKDTGYQTTAMAEATLPIVTMQKDGKDINELFGHRGQLDEKSVRGNIMPLSEDMKIPLAIQAFQSHVEGISYDVRTMDGSRLLQSRQVEDYSEKDGVISAELDIERLLQPEVEYRLTLILLCDGEEIRYYSRLILSDNCYVDETLDFVRSFHEKTFDEKEAASLAAYLEPNNTEDNATLQKVTIHSSLKQIAWAEMKGQVLKDPIPEIQEVSKNYNTILLKYVYASTGENGETEFYNVKEYYRIRYSRENSQIYLLNFERTMNEIFRESNSNFFRSAIRLGIRDPELSYLSNESGTSISFVQEGDLWNYNCVSNQLSMVFSFRGIEGVNDRENRQEHDIGIIKVDESGNTDFVVYGYMNRGEHEGYTGVGVYHYDAVANTVQEQLFVESTQPYQALRHTWGRLFYVSDSGYFYMVAEDVLYCVNLADGVIEAMQRDMDEDSFAAAAGGRYIAWRNADQSTITVTDLEKNTQWKVEGEPGAILYPIGFVESDFVYGVANEGAKGSSLMYKLAIRNQQGEVIKEYEKQDLFLTNAYVDKVSVVLNRVRKMGDVYVPMDDDAIKSSEVEAAQSIQVNTVYDSVRQTLVELTLSQELPRRTLQLLTPKEVVASEKRFVTLKSESPQGGYYVYRGDVIVLNTADVGEAVRCASDNAGVVVGKDHQYIWRRGRGSYRKIAVKDLPFDVNSLPTMAGGPEEILRAAVGDAQILNLTGCNVSQALYYVDQGNPVLSYDSQGKMLLIVGFDFYNVVIYDFEEQDTYLKSLSDSQEFFREAGNIFIAYLTE